MKIERHETGPRMSKVVIHGDTVYLRPASLPIVRKAKARQSRPEASTTDISADGPISHCPAIPAALIRSAHLSMSLRSNFAKYSGLLCSGADARVPRSCIRSRTDSVSSASDVAWLRRRTIGSGVPFGKKKAFQPSMATSVKPCSRAVARFGSLLARLGVRLAIAFTVFC
jgi:hypothetical protein